MVISANVHLDIIGKAEDEPSWMPLDIYGQKIRNGVIFAGQSREALGEGKREKEGYEGGGGGGGEVGGAEEEF